MRPYTRQIQLLRPLRPPNRFFTQPPRLRPELPFLSQPNPTQQVRFLTTERKQWLKSEFIKAGKYTLLAWTFGTLLLVIGVGFQQEWLNRTFPSPDEWSWLSRWKFRSTRGKECVGDEDSADFVDWAMVGSLYRDLLGRLEDPKIDGAGLTEQDEGGILVEGIGRTGYDITEKPESWRRGYHEVLMGAARAAEQLDGCVTDRTRHITFPANVVIGPSNPNPRPVPPGAYKAPREEDCDQAFEPPETYYMRILTTKGFTERQKLNAALGYASWLDFKGTPNAAEAMYKWALDIVTSSTPDPSSLIDLQTGHISPTAGPISVNIYEATTALASHHARTSSLSLALPLFLSILRSRRQQPAEKPNMRSTLVPDPDQDDTSTFKTVVDNIRGVTLSILRPPKYPPPPPDGTSPPPRDAKERCEEAVIMANIGEIFYASVSTNNSTSGRGEGLAWTREAVDVAEEELRGRGIRDAGAGTGDGGRRAREAKKTCRQCLQMGLGNWEKMIETLATEERERKEKRMMELNNIQRMAHTKSSSSWFGLFGTSASAGTVDDEVKRQQKARESAEAPAAADPIGRWEAEELVVKERIRRANAVLENGRRGEWGGFFS